MLHTHTRAQHLQCLSYLEHRTSHTALSHTTLSHTSLSHIVLSQTTLSHTHTPLFHRQLFHTLFRIQLRHTELFSHTALSH